MRSLEQIAQDYPTVKDLRKVVSQLGIKVIRNGEPIHLSHTKKHELIEAISIYESQQVQAVESVVKPVEPVKSVVEPVELVEEEYPQKEELVRSLVSKYYKGFSTSQGEIIGVREFAQEQVNRAQTNQPLFDNRLFATVSHFKDEVMAEVANVSQDGKPSATTAINLRGEVLKRIEKIVNVEKNQFTVTKNIEGMEITTDYLTQSFQAFRSGAIASFSIIARQKRESQGSNFLERRTSTPHASVGDLIEWAVTRLRNLPTKSLEWREVALAIMVVTGRRPTEVMSTGVFKAIDTTNVEFFGQLKKKTNEEDEKIYRIPCLGNTAKEVEVAIQWLQMMNKRVIPASRSLEDRQEAAKKAHDRFSRYLSEISSEVMPNRLQLANGANWELSENRSRIKPYLARQIYLQIISRMVEKAVNDGMSIDSDLAVTYYSGHYLSIDGKDANAENYLADIVISDMEAIENTWQWQPDLSIVELENIRRK